MSFYCEYPEHVGSSRLVPHPYDRFTKRTTYRRGDGKARLHERSGMRLCRACVELDVRVSDGAAAEQETLL